MSQRRIYERNNKAMPLVVIALVIISIFGVTYSLYSEIIMGENNELITGDIYMHYKEHKEIVIEGALPSKIYDESKYFEFTVDGKNTHSDKDIWYEIILTDGDNLSGKIRVPDKYLKFTLVETKNGVNETVVNGISYDEIVNKKIWVNKIPANTVDNTIITYKLYMWISDELIIGNQELVDKGEANHTIEDWNNSYVSLKVNVKGDFKEKKADKPSINVIKLLNTKIGTGTAELQGVSPVTGTMCTKDCEEYRYIGRNVNNYVSMINKSVTGDDQEETWRIIGIFKEGETQYLRIVRDEVLEEAYLPINYKVDGNNYTIKKSGTNAYWNRLTGTSSDKNNWEVAGLQYYLNTDQDENVDSANKGYMSYLSNDIKQILVDVKHYLGSVDLSSDNAVKAYNHERDVAGCINNRGAGLTNGCYVWSGNAATWTGKVALMYASDYALSVNNSDWNGDTTLVKYDGGLKDTSWIYATLKDTGSKHSWLLSPSSNYSYYSAYMYTSGYMRDYSVDGNNSGVRPVLNLSTQVNVLWDGEGTKDNPYVIVK